MGSFEWHTKTFLWMASHTKTIKILCHKREEESIFAKLLPSLAGNMAKKIYNTLDSPGTVTHDPAMKRKT